MMLAGIIGTCAMAPRQNGLKKPRPLRSFSVQDEISLGKDDSIITKKMSTGNLDINESAGPAYDQGSPLHNIAALSSRFVAFIGDQGGNEEKCKSLNRQDSTSSNSASSESPVFLQEKSFLYQNTRPPFDNINNNSNNKSFYSTKAGVGYSCQPKLNYQDDGYRSFCADSSGSGRFRYHASTPLTETAQMIDSKVEDNSLSFQSQSRGSTRATLVTKEDDELVLTGKNFKAVLQAFRILLKELDAKLVKIETVTDDDDCEIPYSKVKSCDTNKSCTDPNMKSELNASDRDQDCLVTGSLCKQKGLDQSWRYSKRKLLRLSTSLLSHQPPPMWNVIANTHCDCCLHATKVRDYFDPSVFNYHDGTLVVPF